jgi:hypothetical protein
MPVEEPLSNLLCNQGRSVNHTLIEFRKYMGFPGSALIIPCSTRLSQGYLVPRLLQYIAHGPSQSLHIIFALDYQSSFAWLNILGQRASVRNDDRLPEEIGGWYDCRLRGITIRQNHHRTATKQLDALFVTYQAISPFYPGLTLTDQLLVRVLWSGNDQAKALAQW